MKIILIVGIIIVIVVTMLGSAIATINFDLISYTATTSETLNSAGIPLGHVLVVYNPGFSGSAKQAATKIAGELQTSGYTVDLAGVRSTTAANTSSYDIIVAGGPMYFGKVSPSVDGYLKTLALNSEKLGVFATTGSSEYMEVDYTSLENQVTSLTGSSFQGKATIKLILDGNETQNCKELVENLLK